MSGDFLDLSGVHALGAQLLDDRFPLLEGLSPILLKALSASAKEMLMARGVDVVRIGDSPGGLYFIDEGKVEVLRFSRDGLEKVAELGPKDVFGEFGVLRNISRTAVIRTITPCRLIRVESTAVHQVMENHEVFRKRLEEVLARRMRENFFAMHPLFRSAPEAWREQFAAVVRPHYLHRGEVLFEQGQPPKGLWFILSGSASVVFRNQAGAEVIIDLRRAPDVLGEVTVKQGKALAYTAEAVFDLDLWLLPYEGLRRLRSSAPQLAEALERFAMQRAVATAKRLKENLGMQL